MKIYLSLAVRQRAKLMLFTLIVCIVGPIAVNLYYRVTGVEIFLMPFFAFPGVVAPIWVLKGDIKRLTHVIVEEHQFTSYSVLNKKLYTLDLAKPVYYGIFRAQEDLFYNSRFIALSNEKFEFEKDKDWSSYFIRHELRDWRDFLGRYDVKAVLVMPYNDKTKPMMQLEKWQPTY